MPFEKILIAVDDSPESIRACRCGFELAHQLKAAIAVLFVIDKGKETGNPDLGITSIDASVMLRQEAERALDQYIRQFDGIGEVFRFTPEGIPEKVIVSTAAEWKADMIVMGTHGRTGLNRMLSGSVAESVIRHSQIAVLVTPPHREG